jgi:hypothetical protein
MKVSKEVLQEWKELREPGDISLICLSAKCSYWPIYKIIRTGEGSSRFIHAILKFYDRKKVMVKQIPQDQD